MKISLQSGVCLALNVVCAATNVMIAPQVFATGFGLGALAGLIHNLFLRNIAKHDSNEKLFANLNPFPGPLSTYHSYVAMKVNEYGISHLPFYAISLAAGVPLGYSLGKLIAMIPLPSSEQDYKNTFAAIKL